MHFAPFVTHIFTLDLSFQNQLKPISSFLPGANSTLNDKIIKAETLFFNFVAEHNLPFAISDHFTKLCKKMFTDVYVTNNNKIYF